MKALLAPLMLSPSGPCKPGVQLLQRSDAIIVRCCFKQNVFVHHGNPLFKRTGNIYSMLLMVIILAGGEREESGLTKRGEERNDMIEPNSLGRAQTRSTPLILMYFTLENLFCCCTI